MYKIGFGGGCHWCTEAVFQSLIGVEHVAQGWIKSDAPNNSLSEAVIVQFDTKKIDLETLTAIHFYTHSCTSDHSLRNKYRSAVYTFSEEQSSIVKAILQNRQANFEQPILTKVLNFVAFEENKELYQNYYSKNAENQFCQTYIHPKFKILRNRFSKHLDKNLIK